MNTVTYYTAVRDGNWSDHGTWESRTIPGKSDAADAGNYRVAIDMNIACRELRASGKGHFSVVVGNWWWERLLQLVTFGWWRPTRMIRADILAGGETATVHIPKTGRVTVVGAIRCEAPKATLSVRNLA